MNKTVTLVFILYYINSLKYSSFAIIQSVNLYSLKVIKRINISFDGFKEIAEPATFYTDFSLGVCT